MKRMLAIAGLALGALLPSLAQAAVSFPIEYTGNYRLTVSVTNTYGSGTCTDTSALTMTLQGDGTATWRATEITAFIETPTGRPPSCDIRPSGQTVTWTGTHDKVSRFSLPSGSPSLPPITGTFDEQRIRAEYRIGNHTLIEWDLPVAGHLFAIEPDPSQGFDFHKSILEGKGFKFVLRDPHGRDHLDFGTLKISVGGVDTTAHVLSRLSQGIVPFVDESPDSLTKVFWVRPDPNKLMQGHDLFAIPFNGDWPIVLRICDKAGTCFGNTYNVYFGPFVTANKVYRVIDLRCANPIDALVQVSRVTIGNVGIDAPRAAIYVGLTNSAHGMWTYSRGDYGAGVQLDAWWQGSIRPYVPLIPLASGFVANYNVINIPDHLAIPTGSGAPIDRRVPFPDGEFKFVVAAIDTDTGAYRREEHDVTMCRR